LWQCPVQAQSVSASVSAELPTARLLSRYGLEQAWWGHATLNPKRDKVKFLVVDEENVYSQATNGVITAFDADSGKLLWESIVGGMVMTSTITYAMNGKQYVLVNTGEGQSVTSGPLNLTNAAMPKAIRGHNSVVVFALP